MSGLPVLTGYRAAPGETVEVEPQDRKRRVTVTVKREDKPRVTVTRSGERRIES